MKVAVVLTSRLDAGGGFQHELACVEAIAKSNDLSEPSFLFVTDRKENVPVLQSRGIHCQYIGSSLIDRIYRSLKKRNSLTCKILEKAGHRYSAFEQHLIAQQVDLAYFLSPSHHAIELRRTNFIFTVWDLCHRDHPEFPEVHFHDEFERREQLYSRVLTKAVAVISDSVAGKDNIVRRYHVDSERVHVSPFLVTELFRNTSDLSSPAIDIKSKYCLANDYIYYPAQFWPHKNHIYLLEAVKTLKDKHGECLHLLLSGSDKGNLNFVLDRARALGIDALVSYIGFVEEQELPHLYRQALALVMPTYFGPTNIPPLEAFFLGCPVVYPDMAGLREQVGDAAFLVDLKNPASLAETLVRIMQCPEDVAAKQAAGYAIIGNWTDKDYLGMLGGILNDFSLKLKCWK